MFKVVVEPKTGARQVVDGKYGEPISLGNGKHFIARHTPLAIVPLSGSRTAEDADCIANAICQLFNQCDARGSESLLLIDLASGAI